jgi:hypothetical protein
MDTYNDARSEWIGSLITELDLIKEKKPVADPNIFRIQLDKYQLPERIRQTVKTINEEVGYQAVYLLDFLPPQRSVVRLSFSRKKTEYIMEIVLRTSGPAVVFHSVAGVRGSWERCLYRVSRTVGSHIEFNQNFMPETITNEIIRAWFSFLLSGFDKKFKPGIKTRSARIAVCPEAIRLIE